MNASRAWSAAPARADWFLTPYVGVNFGNSADFGDVGDFEDNLEKRILFGGSATWMGNGIVGAEVDFGWAPNFFEMTTGDADFPFGDGNVTTLMGNLVIGAPIGGQSGPGLRPLAWAVCYDDLLTDTDPLTRVRRVEAVDADGRVYQLSRTTRESHPVVLVDEQPDPADLPATYPALAQLAAAAAHTTT